MTRTGIFALICIGLVSAPAAAGVLMELETVDRGGSLENRTTVQTESGKVRMDVAEGSEGRGMSTIFLGDRFVVLDHGKKRYFVVDEAMLDKVGARMNEAMKEMEAQLATLPPEQRAMAEKMMKGQMARLGGGTAEPVETRVEQVGSGEWRSESCTEYDVYRGDERTQQICATPLDDIEGAEEAMRAMAEMAGYVVKMTESIPFAASGSPNPGELIDKVDGFPVITTDYRGGMITGTTTLVNAEEKNLDDGLFEVPPDYTAEDLMSNF